MEKTIKALIISLGGVISATLGIMAPFVFTLMICMALDWITRMYASGLHGNINSKRGIRGIIKKLFYFVAVAVGVVAGTLINAPLSADFKLNLVFGSVVASWLIVNELISITENLDKIGIPMPGFLKKVLLQLKSKYEDEGDKKG